MDTGDLLEPTSMIDSLLSEIQSLSQTVERPDEAEEGRINKSSYILQHNLLRYDPRNQKQAQIDQTARVKPILLTLHCLFPHVLLPALDILDRGLITKRRVPPIASELRHVDKLPLAFEPATYFVQSTSNLGSTSSHNHRGTFPHHPGQTQSHQIFYEVHLQAWNCTCPAFTIAAYGLGDNASSSIIDFVSNGPSAPLNRANPELPRSAHQAFTFGGLFQRVPSTPGDSGSYPLPPTCKHVLAVLLAEACPGVFAEGLNDVDAKTADEARAAEGVTYADASSELWKRLETWRLDTAGCAGRWC